MTYRRVVLVLFAAFMAFMLYMVLSTDTPTSTGTTWPLVVGILVILMLPEKRLSGKMIVDLVQALKGKKNV